MARVQLLSIILSLLSFSACANSSSVNGSPQCSNVYDCICENNTERAYAGLVHCDAHKRKVKVDPLSCVTYDKENKQFVAGTCPFTGNLLANSLHNGMYILSDKNLSSPEDLTDEVMCNLMARKGRLCGHCNKSYTVAISSYSLPCVPRESCHDYYWLVLILVNLGPTTVFFIVIIVSTSKIYMPCHCNNYLHGFPVHSVFCGIVAGVCMFNWTLALTD